MNFYEQLFCRGRTTGEGMTHFERLFAAKFGGSPPPEVREYTGAVPVTITADGTPLIDYLISGNTTQSGTPTPDNPIMPQGTGERTGNLFDYSAITTGYRIQWTNGVPYADDTAIMSDYIPVTEGDYTLNIGSIIIGYAADKSYIGVYRPEETWEKLPSDPISSFTVLSNTNVEFVRLLTYGIYGPITDALMLNLGSTALPYEPYGYFIEIEVS